MGQNINFEILPRVQYYQTKEHNQSKSSLPCLIYFKIFLFFFPQSSSYCLCFLCEGTQERLLHRPTICQRSDFSGQVHTATKTELQKTKVLIKHYTSRKESPEAFIFFPLKTETTKKIQTRRKAKVFYQQNFITEVGMDKTIFCLKLLLEPNPH